MVRDTEASEPPAPGRSQHGGEVTALKKSFWDRLKPVWWMRGAVAAIALVALADQVGLSRDWLRLLHAVGTRWNAWMDWIFSALNLHLPFGLAVMGAEGNLLVLFSVIAIPPAVGAFAAPPRTARNVKSMSAIAICLTCALGTLLAPGDCTASPRTTLLFLVPAIGAVAFALAATASASSLRIESHNLDSRRFLGDPGFALLLAGVMAIVAFTLFVAGAFTGPAGKFDLNSTAGDTSGALLLGVSGTVLALLAMIASNRPYLQALIITLTFLATLELLYLIPVFDRFIQPVVEWLEATPTS